jgi:hypothetical protein
VIQVVVGLLDLFGQVIDVFVIASRRVIVRTSRRTRRSMFSIARLYPTGRTSLNVYAPDIPNVCDKEFRLGCENRRGRLV